MKTLSIILNVVLGMSILAVFLSGVHSFTHDGYESPQQKQYAERYTHAHEHSDS